MEENSNKTSRGLFGPLSNFLKHRFDLKEDQADQNEVVENIKRGVEFRGTNLWILMFAIVVASVGLNVNSTAVIIGAMLISPLMGPIMGLGLSLGINDFELLKKSFRNFIFAVVISLIVSTLYFMISPLTIAQSELLARTTPTLWDVLIATFGGLAGIVAQSRKDRTSTVIPGVAIATALMPPLCTAGFGLARGELSFFAGALYLFFINAVFIALSTYFIVRFMKFAHKKQLDQQRTKKVNRMIATVVLVTIVPSVIIAYGMVRRTIFETSAYKYIEKVFVFDGSQVVSHNFVYRPNSEEGSSIEVVMVGERLSKDAIEIAKNQLELFSLEGTNLVVRQAEKGDELENATLADALRSNTQIIREKNTLITQLEDKLATYYRDTIPVKAITNEIQALYSKIKRVELSRGDIIDTTGKNLGSRIVCVVGVENLVDFRGEERDKLQNWLLHRTNAIEVRIYIDSEENSSDDGAQDKSTSKNRNEIEVDQHSVDLETVLQEE